MVTTYDLRIWDQYYSQWWTLAGITSIQLTKNGDFKIDTGTIITPGDHPHSRLFMYARTAPVPVTWECNGEHWTGQIRAAKRRRDGHNFVWELDLESDDKHLHRIQARSPNLQQPTDVTRAPLHTVVRDLIAQGATRTGLPTYLLIETEGDVVEVEARTENTVGDLLQSLTDTADVVTDIRMLLPHHTIPGDGTVSRWVGPAESRWMSAMLADGHWPHAATTTRIQGAQLVGDSMFPPDYFTARTSVGHLGQSRTARTGISWNPFDVRPVLPSDQRNLYYRDGSRRMQNGVTRTATAAELQQLANTEDRQHFGTFVTQWQAGAWAAQRDLGLLEEAAAAGLLQRADGTPVTPAGIPALHAWIGNDAAWAWQHQGTWVVANRNAWTVESSLRKQNATGSQKQLPGLLIHMHAGRDRREIVMSTADAGGLDAWEATITAPDGAAIITGMQHDQWVTDLMASGGISADAAGGVRAKTSAADLDGGTADAAGERVTDLTVDVLPTATATDSEVAFGSVQAGVDLSVAGAWFHRERYMGLGGSWGPDVASQMESMWAEMQGGTALTLTTAQTRAFTFGADVIREDGTVCPGWRIGDRITFIDDNAQITEIIAGWEFRHAVGEPPRVAPVLGKRINRRTPLDELVDVARAAQERAERNALTPPKRLGNDELVGIIETEYGTKFDTWATGIQSAQSTLSQQQSTLSQQQSSLESQQDKLATHALQMNEIGDHIMNLAAMCTYLADAVHRGAQADNWRSQYVTDIKTALDGFASVTFQLIWPIFVGEE